MRSILLVWASLWAILAFLFLPFTFVFLPQVGIALSTMILPINQWICSGFGVDIQNTFLISDSLAMYSTAFLLAIFSGIVTVGIALKFKARFLQIQRILFLILLVLLAYFLIRYGLDKLFNRQFYTPASNTLHTPTGQLSKDILFWTSMGTSSFYNAFMAIAEVITGILLLIHRTRFLGLIMAFGILANIFAINIGFDITVKYLSGLLLLTSVIYLSFYDARLKSLITGKFVEKETPKLNKTLILILFMPFLVDLAMTYWENPKNESGQSYEIVSVSSKSELLPVNEIARIHFHPSGYFIVENKKQQFTSYKMSADRKFVIVNRRLIPIVLKGNLLIWEEGGSEIRCELKWIELEAMPLKQDKMHWYFEGIEGVN